MNSRPDRSFRFPVEPCMKTALFNAAHDVADTMKKKQRIGTHWNRLRETGLLRFLLLG